MLYELRTYYAVPGRMPNLLARFRDHTLKLFEKNGIENVGYWVHDSDPNQLIYIVRHPDAAAMKANWDKFRNDPAWQKAKGESEADGPIVERLTSVAMNPTDFTMPGTK
tara:strand:+ start:291 stop:617 length:327 start_codon:yes stop_codon:yes gene_type:complete